MSFTGRSRKACDDCFSQRLRPDGVFIAQWAPGLHGQRKIAIGPDDSIYVADSGRNGIVKFSLDGQVLASWGSEGTSDGQFKAVSSVTVDTTNNKVYVADPLNSHTHVFDSNEKFLSKWSVPEWREALGFEDLTFDPDRGPLYAKDKLLVPNAGSAPMSLIPLHNAKPR